MSEQDRIQTLVEEGKISQEKARLLLEALQDIEQDAEGNAKRDEDAHVDVSKSVVPPHPPTSLPTAELIANTPPPGAPEPSFRPPPTSSAREVTRWVTISMLAGDLDVSVDSSLSEPVFEGEAELTRRGGDFEIKQPPRRKNGQSVFGNVLGWAQSGDLEVRIPADYGLELRSQAGDVDIRGVPYLKGKLSAGDITAQDIGGVDLSVQAGDVDVSLNLRVGEHRLRAGAGDVNITISEGSSASVEGKVKVGSLSLKGPFTRRDRTMGGRFEGVVGEGAARLEIDLMAGDVSVKA